MHIHTTGETSVLTEQGNRHVVIRLSGETGDIIFIPDHDMVFSYTSWELTRIILVSNALERSRQN